MTSIYTELVSSSGLSDAHRLVLDAVPSGTRVLDVGCAAGYLGAALSDRGCTVVGLEPDPSDAAQARRHCELVITGDIEDQRTMDELPSDMDVVIFADVLEHLRDPWRVLQFARTLLSPHGRAIVSLPNIGHWTGRRAVLRGAFPYAEFGLFDRTHLRFFTRTSAGQLVRGAGFEIANEQFAAAPLPLEGFATRLGVSRQVISERMAPARQWATARWPELFALQFVLTLTPCSGNDM